MQNLFGSTWLALANGALDSRAVVTTTCALLRTGEHEIFGITNILDALDK